MSGYLDYEGLQYYNDKIQSQISELELYKFPNATIIGEPTINHGQISNFNSANYLKFPFLVDFKNRPFEIQMEFTTGSNVSNQENIFDSDFGLAFAVRGARFVFAVSSTGTSWNIGEGVGTYTVIANTTYMINLAWSGTAYTLAFSTDGGENWTIDIVKNSTESPYPKQIYIGVGQSGTSILNHFTGTINFNYARLYILNELVWQGMDDVGLASRLATDLSNIDSAGITRIKEIASDVKLVHSLTIGEHVFDGSEDVYVPVYDGNIDNINLMNMKIESSPSTFYMTNTENTFKMNT